MPKICRIQSSVCLVAWCLFIGLAKSVKKKVAWIETEKSHFVRLTEVRIACRFTGGYSGSNVYKNVFLVFVGLRTWKTSGNLLFCSLHRRLACKVHPHSRLAEMALLIIIQPALITDRKLISGPCRMPRWPKIFPLTIVWWSIIRLDTGVWARLDFHEIAWET